MLTQKEQEAKEKVICNLAEWIENELKDASSMATESILPELISVLAKLIASTD